MERLHNLLTALKSQLWLIPAAMGAVASILALWMVAGAQPRDVETAQELSWLFSGDAGTARDLLATLLSGMLSLTSIVISITMVVLSLAAGQLGPRLIWIFVRDRQIQTVLGVFFGTILYLLLVLRSLDVALPPEAVPHVAVTLGSALTVGCLFALLFYVHKVSLLLIADTVIASVANDLDSAITTLPERDEAAPEMQDPLPRLPRRSAVPIGAKGYLQAVDRGALLRLAQEHDLHIRLAVRPGRFLLPGQHVATVSHASDDVAQDLQRRIAGSFILGRDRSPAQDLEYPLQQLVETALRALSPGINDPFTAIAALHRLGGALAALDVRDLPPERHADGAGICRLHVDVTDRDGLVQAALNQIRQAGSGQPAVLIAMAELLGQLGGIARRTDMRRALLAQVEALDRLAPNIAEPLDRGTLDARLADARAALQAMPVDP